ncbi:AraC family transcriptional regulator [Pontibacter sp. G13]|uniref:AraC family transcriptional regulator n=1 Tax=Pontibacter sp. G13 TaxID=3074898 RepID=UPI00288B6027|nr:AraC family transcriptional regulator [Pontibacter sp. G13]WNJ17032.1 AraC family transcriptional regulator [Pontibacter sp. G13]
MKALHFPLPVSSKESFHVEYDEGPYFFAPLHFHRELQLTWILESTGTRIVGDSIERFEEQEVVLIGSNVPHVFRNDPPYYDKDSELKAKMLSVFFMPDFSGRAFLELPECEQIHQLVHQAEYGIVLEGDLRNWVIGRMKKLYDHEGFLKLMAFLEILHQISISEEKRFLSTNPVQFTPTKADSHKLNEVFNYVMKHFQDEVRLEAVAEIASMSPTAFSRYFKRQTRKNFSQFLTEIRVGHACKMLLEDQFSIAQIAYQCGFNNISNFNRRFKAVTQLTPSDYQRKHA